MPTIKDVAEHADVSIATVSRVISKPESVTAATQERVRASISALGYEPNSAAKSMRTSRVSKILVTVPDIANPFFSSVIRGAEDQASLAGYSIVLGNTRYDPDREEQYGAMLSRRDVDGLIFLGHHLPPNLARLLKAQPNAPIVNGCEYSPDLPVTTVHIDNQSAARDAIAYLYLLGHVDIGVITGPLASPISRDRLAGVNAMAAEVGHQRELRVMIGDFSIESGAQEARKLLTTGTRPSGIFCFSDEMALGALATIRGLGLDCPGDVSLIGFDDIRFATYTHPTLTTMSQPAEGIGRESVRLLLDILDGRAVGQACVTLPHQLVVRRSTGAGPRHEGKSA